MKRFAFVVGSLLSTFACSSSVPPADDTTPAHAASSVSMDLVDEAAAATVPTGTFANLESFCAAQRAMIEPRIADAKKSFASDGFGDLDVAPSCEINDAALKDTTVVLGSGFRDVKAVMVESGYSTAIYLVAQTSSGWFALRTPILESSHDDPGCGSIERAMTIKEIKVANGMLVVENDAGRTWAGDADVGELTLTYARSCSIGASCGPATVVAAKVVIEDPVNTDGPTRTRFFTTSYSIAPNGAVRPAVFFDEATL